MHEGAFCWTVGALRRCSLRFPDCFQLVKDWRPGMNIAGWGDAAHIIVLEPGAVADVIHMVVHEPQ